MSTLPPGPQHSLRVQDIEQWLLATQEQRAALHIKAADHCHDDDIYDAFTGMSALLQKSLEELRMVSQSLQERSLAVHEMSADLHTRSTRLRERSKVLMERMEAFTSSPPEEIRQAESRMLALFKPSPRHEER
jgi:hypothetical protein